MGQTLPVMVELPSDALTTRKPGESLHRVRVIAAIHAMAEWFAEHPDVPVPSSIEASAYQHGNDYDAQIRRVAGAADAYDGKISSSGTSVWVELHPISDTDGAKVSYTLFGTATPAGLDGILAAATGGRS